MGSPVGRREHRSEARWRWSLIGALAASSLGCYHASETAGDRALQRAQYDEATRHYQEALKSGELLGWEQDRVREKVGHTADARVTEAIRAATGGSIAPEDQVQALAKVRVQARSTGVERALDEELVATMRERARKALDDVHTDQGVEAGPFLGRVRRAERAVASFAKTEPLWNELGALRSRAAAHHGKLAADVGALGEGASGSVVLHTALAARFGGTPGDRQAALTALAERADIVWSVTSEGGTCGAQATGLAQRFPGTTVGHKATVALSLTSCEPTSKRWDTEETYTYTVSVPYQDVERVQTGTRRVETTDYRSEQVCSTTKVLDKPVTECHTEQRPYQSFSFEPVFELRPVTKYRDEQRTGTRTEHHERYGFQLRGQLVARLEDGAQVTVDVSASKDAEDTGYSTPHGSKEVGKDVSAAAVERGALDAAYAKTANMREQFARAIATELEATAKRASGEKQTAVAESAYLAAVRAAGAPSAESAAWFKEHYDLEPIDLTGIAAGKTIAEPELAPPLEEMTVDRAATEGLRGRQLEHARNRYALWFLGGRATMPNLLNQPDRAGAAGGLALGAALLGGGWGFTVHDEAWFEVLVGGRTSAPVEYGGDQREDKYTSQLHVAYTLMLGYRSERVGLFAGARAGYHGLRIGDASASGTYVPLTARAELRLGGPAVIVAYGWAAALAGKGEARGLALDIPLARKLIYLRGQVEQWKVETTVLDAGKNEQSAARQVALLTNFGLGMMF